MCVCNIYIYIYIYIIPMRRETIPTAPSAPPSLDSPVPPRRFSPSLALAHALGHYEFRLNGCRRK